MELRPVDNAFSKATVFITTSLQESILKCTKLCFNYYVLLKRNCTMFFKFQNVIFAKAFIKSSLSRHLSESDTNQNFQKFFLEYL